MTRDGHCSEPRSRLPVTAVGSFFQLRYSGRLIVPIPEVSVTTMPRRS